MPTSKYDVVVGDVLEAFENVSDWTITGGTGENDTTNYRAGTQSLRLIAGAGGNSIATKTINVNMAIQGMPFIELYVPTLVGFTSFQIILSNDSGFTNFFSRSLSGFIHEGWNRIPMSRDLWASNGSPSWDSNMVRLRVRINATEGFYANFDSFVYNYYARPKIIISADDGWATQHSEMFQWMKQYGFKGSLYLIKERIGTTNYMTEAMVTEMFNAGWDVLNHTVNHFNMRDELSTQAEVEAELAGCADWIVAKGWSRLNGQLHVAYPNGAYDAKVLGAMATQGMSTGRTTLNRTQAHEIDAAYLLTRQSHAYTAAQATWRGYIDRTIKDCGSVQINYHKIVPDGTGAFDTEVEQAQFRDLIDYLYTKRNQCDVVTYLEWYRGLTNARRLV